MISLRLISSSWFLTYRYQSHDDRLHYRDCSLSCSSITVTHLLIGLGIDIPLRGVAQGSQTRVSRAGVFTSRGGGRRLGRRRSASQPCHTRTDGRPTCRRRRRRRDACLRSDSVHHLGKRRDARAGIAPTCD